MEQLSVNKWEKDQLGPVTVNDPPDLWSLVARDVLWTCVAANRISDCVTAEVFKAEQSAQTQTNVQNSLDCSSLCRQTKANC